MSDCKHKVQPERKEISLKDTVRLDGWRAYKLVRYMHNSVRKHSYTAVVILFLSACTFELYLSSLGVIMMVIIVKKEKERKVTALRR